MAAGFFGKVKRTGGIVSGLVTALGIPTIAKGVSGLANWASKKLGG